jgi:hypothetical protein
LEPPLQPDAQKCEMCGMVCLKVHRWVSAYLLWMRESNLQQRKTAESQVTCRSGKKYLRAMIVKESLIPFVQRNWLDLRAFGVITLTDSKPLVL